jgi:hypothetical protein
VKRQLLALIPMGLFIVWAVWADIVFPQPWPTTYLVLALSAMVAVTFLTVMLLNTLWELETKPDMVQQAMQRGRYQVATVVIIGGYIAIATTAREHWPEWLFIAVLLWILVLANVIAYQQRHPLNGDPELIRKAMARGRLDVTPIFLIGFFVSSMSFVDMPFHSKSWVVLGTISVFCCWSFFQYRYFRLHPLLGDKPSPI